jgi:hypothetical protein
MNHNENNKFKKNEWVVFKNAHPKSGKLIIVKVLDVTDDGEQIICELENRIAGYNSKQVRSACTSEILLGIIKSIFKIK